VVKPENRVSAKNHPPSGPTIVEKKWRLLRTWASRHPMWCAWQVTYRCNYHCAFCHYWRDPMGELAEQTVEQFEEGSRKLASLGALFVSLAGGEPLMRPDFPDIVRAVARWHLPFVTTNGAFVTPELARELFGRGLWGASVSIDYADPARHDKARGAKGGFDRAMAALEYFSKARRHPWQRVNLLCVLLHDNLEHVEELIRLAARLDVFFMVQPYSDAKTGSSRFHCGNPGVSDRLLALKRKYTNFLSNPYFLGRFDQYLTEGVPDCRAGQAFFNIDSVGDVSICVERRRQPVANLYEHSARRIVEALRVAGERNECRDCWYNCRGEMECLYRPASLLKSLPLVLFDRGRPSGNGRGNGNGRHS
jgi:MoaA/NifB/PqqE/SkfB family radical SAM enzyme